MHTGPITSVIFKDEETIYTGGYDKQIFKWNILNGSSKLLGAHNHLVNSLALSNSKKYLASASSDYSIAIYDLNTDTLINTLYGHSDDVEAVSFSVDEKLLISTSRDARCLVWDLNTGKIINEYKEHEKDVLAVWVNHNYAFTTGDDGRVLVWEILTGKTVNELGPFNCEIDTITGNLKQNLIALGMDNGDILLFDANSLKLLKSIKGHKQGVKKVSFSESGNYILTAGYDHLIRIWRTNDLKHIIDLEQYKYQWERSLVWSDNETTIYGASFGNTYCEWSIIDGKLKNKEIKRATPSINDFAIAKNEIIMTASDDGILRSNGVEIATSDGVLTNAVGTSYNAEFVAWGDHAGKIHLITQSQKGIQKKEFDLNTGPINSIFYDENGEKFYVGTYGGYVHEISTVSKEVEEKYKMHSGAVKAVQANKDYIVSVSSDASIKVISKQNRDTYQLYGPNAIINDLYLDPKGDTFVLVSRDKVVRLYDIKTGKILGQHNKHKYSIKSVTMNGNGVVYSGDYWGYCVKWDINTNIVSSSFKVSTNGLSAFRVIDNQVYCSSYDGAIYKITNEDYTEVLRLFTQNKVLVKECSK